MTHDFAHANKLEEKNNLQVFLGTSKHFQMQHSLIKEIANLILALSHKKEGLNKGNGVL